jgi:hypothetical protein
VADPTLVLELGARGRNAVRVEWDLGALADIGDDDEPDGRPFRVEGAFDAGRWELARVLSGALDDGRLLAVAALRPRDAHGHGDEAIAGALVRDGERAMLDEVLISVEYGPDGKPRRLGLEIYERPDSLPLRVAGDLIDAATAEEARFELRSEGTEGTATLVVVRPS